MLKTLILTLLARVPWATVIEVIREQFERKVQPAILREIDRLVDYVDDMDLSGEDKFRWVFDALRASDSPVKAAATNTATYLLDTAIQVSLAKLRAFQ
jgi:hypothetical protein